MASATPSRGNSNGDSVSLTVIPLQTRKEMIKQWLRQGISIKNALYIFLTDGREQYTDSLFVNLVFFSCVFLGIGFIAVSNDIRRLIGMEPCYKIPEGRF